VTIAASGFLALGLLWLSAVFSGSETGVYTISRIQLDEEAARGGTKARLLRFLLRHDAGLLITLLIGNNLALELLTDLVRHEYAATGLFGHATLEAGVTLTLTPLVFLFGELLPKDSFRRRPRFFLGASAWILALVRVLFLPLALPLRWLSLGLERLFGVRGGELSRALGREEVLELLRIGTSQGSLEERVEELVQNVFVLRSTPVTTVMVPWERVVSVDLEDTDLLARVEASEFTRIPVSGSAGGGSGVRGYLQQLDVHGRPIEEMIRPLPAQAPSVSVDRALAKMQLAGQRIALVGTPEEPLGLLAMMDLVAVIAGVRAA